MRRKVLISFVCASAMWAGTGQAVPVDLELALLNDVSGSVDSNDFALQRNGYEAAFRDGDIISKIMDGSIGSIAVTLVDWSSSASVAVDWTQISDAASANAFADAIAEAPRGGSGTSTGMTNGLNFGVDLFTDNGYEGTRNVIDVSGDGSESVDCIYSSPVCEPLQAARDSALASDIDTINALWIDDREFFGDDPNDQINALDYGATNVIAGPGAFQDIVQDFNGFSDAISAKILREIDPEVSVPAPGALGLMGLGLFGMLVGARRRR
ncbi:DUF1194 domain-containing protein [Aquisalimonas lutea]|uniref:DUF1194 domain-containing protein n=1 Tax=Aquisalimonas lutea TaxID=1327750 RepID=UPI0025B441B5|nr:DUF1194 domain-containing protein [Aquisalimonas lutea]MDN3517170.1 DUF1194 domain-containing protein [Aquisalimonas lutea]